MSHEKCYQVICPESKELVKNAIADLVWSRFSLVMKNNILFLKWILPVVRDSGGFMRTIDRADNALEGVKDVGMIGSFKIIPVADVGNYPSLLVSIGGYELKKLGFDPSSIEPSYLPYFYALLEVQYENYRQRKERLGDVRNALMNSRLEIIPEQVTFRDFPPAAPKKALLKDRVVSAMLNFDLSTGLYQGDVRQFIYSTGRLGF